MKMWLTQVTGWDMGEDAMQRTLLDFPWLTGQGGGYAHGEEEFATGKQPWIRDALKRGLLQTTVIQGDTLRVYWWLEIPQMVFNFI